MAADPGIPFKKTGINPEKDLCIIYPSLGYYISKISQNRRLSHFLAPKDMRTVSVYNPNRFHA